jgi:hypothetical protein
MNYSSLNVFDDGAVLLRSVIWNLSIVLMFFKTTTFQGMVLPSSSGENYSVGYSDRASLYWWTLSTKYAGHTFQLCEDLTMSYKVKK